MSGNKQHYWCRKCDIPLLGPKCFGCGEHSTLHFPTESKPVFRIEYKYLLEAAKNDHLIDVRRFPKVLFRHKNNLYSDISESQVHYKIKVKDNDLTAKNEAGELFLSLIENIQPRRSKIEEFFLDSEEYMEKIIKSNLPYLKAIENESIDFIKNVSKKYKNYFQICSFSGGKDSSVVAHLVKKALGKITVVFSDTGIEFMETKKYAKEYGKQFGDFVYLDKLVSFKYMCETLGPPSRTIRWCCFTNKGAPFGKYYAEIPYKKVLSFDGIRFRESNSRSLFSRERDNTKYEKQFSAYPILDWTALEVWLYIFWRKIPYNPLYEYGFARIGCWACPNNTNYDWFLFSKSHPKKNREWFKFLNDFRKIQTQKVGDNREYDLSYIEKGDWKSRRVKYNTIPNLIDLSINNNIYEFTLKYPIRKELREFFAIFGKISESDDSKIDIRNKDLIISYYEGKNQIRIIINNNKRKIELLKSLLRQINKSYNCINCGACVGSCPQGAIYLDDSHVLRINQEKCIHCYICAGTKFLDRSCIALHYKEKRIYIKFSDLNIFKKTGC
ncbi:MAG: phosphoadenosine phosphosulfate reductase domain-containing protein [Promethearchaeota archaeon]